MGLLEKLAAVPLEVAVLSALVAWTTYLLYPPLARRWDAIATKHPLAIRAEPAITTAIFSNQGDVESGVRDRLLRHNFSVEVTNVSAKTVRNASLEWSYANKTYLLKPDLHATHQIDIRPGESVRWTIAFSFSRLGPILGMPETRALPQGAFNAMRAFHEGCVCFVRWLPDDIFMCIPPLEDAGPLLDARLLADETEPLAFSLAPVLSPRGTPSVKISNITPV